MARNTNVTIAAATWTQLTASDVTSITFQNLSGSEIMVAGTAGATPPSDEKGAIRYAYGEGERNVALADLFPGISATRVYAYCTSGGLVMVSHA